MTENKDSEKNIKKLKDRTLQLALKLGAIFATTSIVGVLLGKFLDNKFDIAPYGTVGVMAVFYVLTWAIILKIYFNLQKEMQEKDE